MDLPSSPALADEPVLHELGYHVYDSDQNMSLTQNHFMAGPSTEMNDAFNLFLSTPNSESSEQCWKPSLETPPGREGETPYLHLNDFESAEDLLDPYNDQIDSETLFTSLQESVHWRSQQVVENKPEYDETIPRDLHKKRACVKLLFKAWKSTASATDNPGMKKPFEEERHDNARVECLCWVLLEALIRRSELGPLLEAYDPAKSKDNPAINSFAVRFDEVVISLREQKTICKHLLDAPYVNTFVDDPVRARNRVASNRDLNQKKGHTMSLGKLHKETEQGTTRTKEKKRARSPSTDGHFSDEPNAKHSHSSATLYGTPTRSAYRSRGHSKTGTGSSSQYTPASMRSGYGNSGLYTGSPAGLHMNARIPPISHPTSPTSGHGLTLQNTQSSSGQPVVQSPPSTPLELPQSVFGNYNTMMGQTMQTRFMFPTPTVAHSTLLGFGGQFPFTSQPSAPTSTARFTPSSATRQPQLEDDSSASA